MGLPVTPEVLLSDPVIERFIVAGVRDGSPAGKRSLRTNLRFLADHNERAGRPAPVPLPRQRAKPPYGEAEMAAYFALADAQPTLLRRMRCMGLLSLGAGAGAVGTDLRFIRGVDVVRRSGGVVVDIAGPNPRSVPVRRCYHGRLLAAASFAGESSLVGVNDPKRHNITAPLVGALSGGVDLPRLDTGRLRSTWLSHCAGELGIKAFLEAAGVTCSQRLGDLMTGVPTVDEKTAVALLSGVR